MTYPACPSCNENYTYADGDLLICPMCAHEWSASGDSSDDVAVIKDAVGNVLNDGDSVTVIKDLKVKGSSTPIKVGTKVKSIRLIHDAPDDHDIDCKIDGFGAMKLKSSVVKKA
ncbi:alkylphosphonate utilization protein [Moraxella caviae]|uniref:Alkylphosphonate utilization protein n=1 Tax=Moraxella caviae TaxID=34060 RepID=A0A1T0A255_9GAMM|nr:zinc ribbon domain-containing protein YjdM [Moraxella caviae]OOR89767.1 alkylphosphonate utilization protein [Moraxella caviae]STZ10708.1 putative alkylphosphonate utilization operon protein PhnA [Moraxella caviae]